MSEENTPLGTLFGVINYSSNEDIEKFIQNMTPQQALFCVVQSCKQNHTNNFYSSPENEIINKAITVLTTPVPNSVGTPPEPEFFKM
jgi:hypothetical protein